MVRLWISIALGLALAGPAGAQVVTDDLTRGFRFDLPMSTVAEAPSDPKVAYVGTGKGFVYATRDGGKSWVEYEVLPTRGRFVGSIRRFGGFFSQGGVGLRSVYTQKFKHWLAFMEPDVLNDRQNLDFVATGMRFNADRAVDYNVAASSAAGGGADASLGVGLSAGAPRLASRVRSLKGWGIGINLKQTLSLKGFPSTWINHLDVDPRDANVILAATGDGLRRSTDGGASWPVVLSGATQLESRMYRLARDPNNPDVVLAGSAVGLYRSTDGGRSFTRFIDPLVSNADVNWVAFHPTDSQRVLVSLTWGLLETRNGKDFKLLFRDSWAPLAYVRKAIYDPHQPDRVLAATNDGLLVAEPGKTFERMGGLQFVGNKMVGLAPSATPGLFRAVTEQDVWETEDGGRTWRVLLFGGIQWRNVFARASMHDPSRLWVLTQAEVLQVRTGQHQRLTPGVRRRYGQLVSGEPTVDQAVGLALRRAGASVEDQFAYRARARWKGVVPTLRVSFQAFGLNANGIQAADLQPDGSWFAFNRDGVIDRPYAVMGWLNWDLRALVHDRAESTANRVGGINRTLEWRVRSTTIALYQERRRLQLDALTELGDDRSRLMRNLRLEELTAHLNALTGDAFEPYSAL